MTDKICAWLCMPLLASLAGMALREAKNAFSAPWTLRLVFEFVGLGSSLFVLAVMFYICWTIAFERPGPPEAAESPRTAPPLVTIPCDQCERNEAVCFCRTHRLYACLGCANLHDRHGCSYDVLPVMGLVCKETGVSA